jgi:hypothetical protein
LLEVDAPVRIYRIEPALVESLQHAFALAEARPDLVVSADQPTSRGIAIDLELWRSGRT